MQIRRKIATALAAAATGALPVSAAAQEACLTETQVSAMVVYGVPLAMGGLQQSCGEVLSPDGFLATGAPAMADRYAAQSDAAWPDAFSAFLSFAGSGGQEGVSAMREMPEEALRPFLDALITGLIANEVKPEKCGNIERLLEVLAPLEPFEAGRLAAVIAAMAGVEDPEICDS
ncbi:hypothetical protein [Aurantiacibacter gilvus]|uniref:Secreted protein n=1 Tax=Aurantiacibacter gilvus TaxID=3139141 RepID=A0ABU9ID13_9SPHN